MDPWTNSTEITLNLVPQRGSLCQSPFCFRLRLNRSGLFSPASLVPAPLPQKWLPPRKVALSAAAAIFAEVGLGTIQPVDPLTKRASRLRALLPTFAFRPLTCWVQLVSYPAPMLDKPRTWQQCRTKIRNLQQRYRMCDPPSSPVRAVLPAKPNVVQPQNDS